jgi:hypothetical protein
MACHANKHNAAGLAIVFALILVVLGWYFPVAEAVTNYPAGSLLQPNDVTSSHIREGTIVDADVSAAALIQGTKVAPNGTTGTVLLTDGTTIATTSKLKFSTTTAELYVEGGKVSASTTNFGGVDQTWPSTAGSSGQFLSTDGVGTYSWVSPTSAYLTVDLEAGEAFTAGQAAFIASTTPGVVTPTTFATSNSGGSNFGLCPDGATKVAQSFQSATAFSFSLANANLYKIGSPTTDIVLSVQTDAAGVPSGTQVASTTLDGALLTDSSASYTFTFPSEVSISASTLYWLVFEIDGACDSDNKFSLSSSNTNPYASGSVFNYNGSVWANLNVDAQASLKRVYSSGAAYKTHADNGGYAVSFFGFAQENIAASTTGTFVVGGVMTSLTGLETGSFYYLSNTTGAISTSTGTFTRKVGLALSETVLLITNIW